MKEFDLLAVLMSDAGFIFSSWRMADFAIPIAFLLWGLVLMVPLTGVDRRDTYSLAGYLAFALFCGITLIIVVPNHHLETKDLGFQLMICGLVSFFSLYRWHMKPKSALAISEAIKKLEQEGKASHGKSKAK